MTATSSPDEPRLHNPWDASCVRNGFGEPSREGERCLVCFPDRPPVGDTTDRSDEIAELCRILNSVGIDTLDGEDGPLIEALMAWKFSPVGDTTQPTADEPVKSGWYWHRSDCADNECQGCATQPQPTDDGVVNAVAQAICDGNFMQPTWHLLDPDSHHIYRRMARAAIAAMLPSGPDLVGAVAEIRALHARGMWTATGRFYCKHCRNREVEWPCPTIAALDKAGAP